MKRSPGPRVKAQSELAGDCKSAAEMTAPRAPRGVTAWMNTTEINNIFDNAMKEIAGSNNGLFVDLDKMAEFCSSPFEEAMEVNLASPRGDAGKRTPQIR